MWGRVSRVHGQRGQNREDVAHEILAQAYLGVGVQILPAHDADVLLLQGGQHLLVEYLGVALLQLVGVLGNLLHLLLGAQTGGGGHGQPGGDAALQAGHAHHEELVEVGSDDGQEVQALQQVQVRILRQLQHAGVEVEPAALAVEETLGAELFLQAEVGSLLALLDAVAAGVRALDLGDVVADVDNAGHGRRFGGLGFGRLIHTVRDGYHTVLPFLCGSELNR